MNRLLLTLLVSPTLFGSLMSLSAIANPAQIGETPSQSADSPQCVRSPHTQRLTCVRLPAKTAAGNSKPRISWQRPADRTGGDAGFFGRRKRCGGGDVWLRLPGLSQLLRQLRGLPPLDLAS